MMTRDDMSLHAPPKPAAAADVQPDRPLPPWPAHWTSLPRAFLHQARARAGAEALADSTGASLTYGETLLRAVALGRVLARELGPEPYVGLFLPPTVAGAVANLALVLRGKIPVNLNYTASQEVVDASIDQCGIRHTLTAAKALGRFPVR